MLARAGFRVTLLEQAERLEETGAGIQLSPNATRILIALGLGERLRADVFVPRGGRDQDRERRQACAHPARRRGRAPLRRALLGDPSRRPAGGAAGGGARQSRHRAAARHAGRGFRRACQRAEHRLPARRRHRRRTRHRADRRRRAVVGAARAARPSGRRNSASAPPGARSFPPMRSRRNSALPTCSSGSGRTRIWSTIR